jgi:hypothetical protein
MGKHVHAIGMECHPTGGSMGKHVHAIGLSLQSGFNLR